MKAQRIAMLVLVCALAASANAAPVDVSSYDIHDAVASGYGGWSHAYNGTITPVRGFMVGSNTGTIANYAGGSGTLNDKTIGTSTNDTQLFVSGDFGGPTSPVITLKLAQPVAVNKIDLYGSDQVFNLFPGAISAVTVEIGGQSVAITTTPFGEVTFLGTPFNDSISLADTPLAGTVTDTIVLRDFVFDPITFGQFVITEIMVDGTSAPTAQQVAVDVKPFFKNNVIYLGGRPAVAVAILSSAKFDARTVNRSTLTFGRTGDERSLLFCLPPVDWNRDGRQDLLCKFRVSATGLQVGDTNVVLKGSTRTGEAFTGRDDVTVQTRPVPPQDDGQEAEN